MLPVSSTVLFNPSSPPRLKRETSQESFSISVGGNENYSRKANLLSSTEHVVKDSKALLTERSLEEGGGVAIEANNGLGDLNIIPHEVLENELFSYFDVFELLRMRMQLVSKGWNKLINQVIAANEAHRKTIDKIKKEIKNLSAIYFSLPIDQIFKGGIYLCLTKGLSHSWDITYNFFYFDYKHILIKNDIMRIHKSTTTDTLNEKVNNNSVKEANKIRLKKAKRITKTFSDTAFQFDEKMAIFKDFMKNCVFGATAFASHYTLAKIAENTFHKLVATNIQTIVESQSLSRFIVFLHAMAQVKLPAFFDRKVVYMPEVFQIAVWMLLTTVQSLLLMALINDKWDKKIIFSIYFSLMAMFSSTYLYYLNLDMDKRNEVPATALFE